MKNIFVGNLDFNTGEEELRQLFGRYGNVARVAVMTDRDTGRSRGFAFVEMTNTDAIADLNGTQLDGRTTNEIHQSLLATARSRQTVTSVNRICTT